MTKKLSLKNRRVVLIGGAGFIGHNMALHLKKMGAEVSIVDSLQVNNILAFSNPNLRLPHLEEYLKMLYQRLEALKTAGIPFHVQDARDYHKLSILFSEIRPQVVIQLAAIAHANVANKDPFNTFDHSLRTLENALDSSRGHVEHFIYFSSSMVYGHFTRGQVDEESPCDPLGIYGALKYSGEKIVVAYRQVFDLPYTIVRPSALYGPRCVSRRVLQIFIEQALSGETLCLQGDGSDSLDFTYVDDLIQGVEKIIENPKSKNEIFNLTYGQSRSLDELVSLLKHDFPELSLRHEAKDRLMPDRGTLSVDKARSLLDYRPAFSLEKGLKAYLDWYRRFWKL
jgi:nucleoside-diphosphate-sugar epimerase